MSAGDYTPDEALQMVGGSDGVGPGSLRELVADYLERGERIVAAEADLARLTAERDEARAVANAADDAACGVEVSDFMLSFPQVRRVDDLRIYADEKRDLELRLRERIVAAEADLARLRARASTLEDAAFHFQTCRVCRKDGDDTCPDGRQFAAFLRGEEVNSGN